MRSRRVARAAQSLRCSMRIHQESVQVCAYRLLITARGVRVCVRGCGAVCGCGVQAQQRGSSDKCLIVIMPSGSGSGPPKPPLTRHRVSSSERAGQCDAARANARRAGRQGWRESVLSIHDPWCYTLSCNTCNLSRHPLSRAVCGAGRCRRGRRGKLLGSTAK